MKTSLSSRQSAPCHILKCRAQSNNSCHQAIQPPRTIVNSTHRSNVPSLWERCAVSVAIVAAQALALTTVLVVAPPPALANTENYTIDVHPTDDVENEYFQTVPQGLSAADEKPKVALSSMLEGKKGKEVQQCVRKCIPTCTRTGQGAPGLGPMTARKEMVVFKEGYHSRQYCLSEVSSLSW